MARVTVEDCLELVPSRFALVLLVSRRAKQFLKGADPTLSGKNNKYIVTALREVAVNNVRYEIDLSHQSQEQQIENDLNR